MAANLITESIITDVDSEARKVLWKYWLLFVIGGIGTIALTWWIYQLSFVENRVKEDYVFWPLIGFILVFSIARAVIQDRFRAKLMRQFAEMNGLRYTETGMLDDKHGMLFKNVTDREVYNVVSGTLHGLGFSFYNYGFAIGKGKYKKTYDATVLEVQFAGLVPEFFLEERKHSFRGVTLRREGQREFELEGDFRKYFSLYVSEDHGIETLEILTPEVMAFFIDKAPHLSFEFYGSKLYIYQDHFVHKKDELTSFFKLAKFLISLIGPRIGKLHDDVAAIRKLWLGN